MEITFRSALIFAIAIPAGHWSSAAHKKLSATSRNMDWLPMTCWYLPRLPRQLHLSPSSDSPELPVNNMKPTWNQRAPCWHLSPIRWWFCCSFLSKKLPPPLSWQMFHRRCWQVGKFPSPQSPVCSPNDTLVRPGLKSRQLLVPVAETQPRTGNLVSELSQQSSRAAALGVTFPGWCCHLWGLRTLKWAVKNPCPKQHCHRILLILLPTKTQN